MVVASLLDGRVRIRDEGLKREQLVSRIREALLATPGVSIVESNPRVGSLLVIFSAALTAVDKLLKMVSDLLGPTENPNGGGEAPKSSGILPLGSKLSFTIPPGVKRRLVNLGMLTSLALSLAAAVFGFKKLHILAGIVFVALFGDHFYQKRAVLFA